jgi:hypothetical protein
MHNLRLQMACLLIHIILKHVATDNQGLRGGDTHVSILNHLISHPLERGKLYRTSQPRVLSLCQAALFPQPHDQLPHGLSPWRNVHEQPSVSEALQAGTSAACFLLVECLMASADSCAELLPFCCQVFKQAASSHGRSSVVHVGATYMPQQSAGQQSVTVLPPKLLQYLFAGAMDAVNLHFNLLQTQATVSIVECSCFSHLWQACFCSAPHDLSQILFVTCLTYTCAHFL